MRYLKHFKAKPYGQVNETFSFSRSFTESRIAPPGSCFHSPDALYKPLAPQV
jgi:hypothetical protein